MVSVIVLIRIKLSQSEWKHAIDGEIDPKSKIYSTVDTGIYLANKVWDSNF